jgi:predicted transposase YbfD/YdcC
MTDKFIEHFTQIKDPRIERCKIHNLFDIIFLAICAVLSGAQSWTDIQDFGKYNIKWLQQYRTFKNGIPHYDTISRVMSRLDPEQIENSFRNWMSTLIEVTKSDVIAIDGKVARRSFSSKTQRNALHCVSAYSCENKIVLGQVNVDEKSNEIKAIPELLQLLDIEKSIITIDAMGCQRDIAKQIIDKKADYILALKGNHSGLKSQLEKYWEKTLNTASKTENFQEKTHLDSGHGRVETRVCKQLLIDENYLEKKYNWDGLKSVIKITTELYKKSTKKTTNEIRWYISSLKLDAKVASKAIRSHWQVESMHWILDMTFREDESRIRKKGQIVFNILRKISLALLKKDKTKNLSIRRKIKIAGYDGAYRSTLLATGSL